MSVSIEFPDRPAAGPSRGLAPRLGLASAGSPWRRMRRKHVIMLVLAAEVLVMGWRCSDRYRPPGIVVDATFTEGNEIT